MPSATATAAPEGAAGNTRRLALPRIGRRPVMRIDAQTGIGELRHRRFANHHRAGLQQPFHYRSVFFSGWRVRQYAGTGRGHLTGHVKQIPDRDRHAIQRRQRRAGGASPIGGLRLPLRPLGVCSRKRASPPRSSTICAKAAAVSCTAVNSPLASPAVACIKVSFFITPPPVIRCCGSND